MAEDRKQKHNIILEQRENISVTGVIDVLSFDEEEIVSETEMGVLVISGTNLHVSKLNLDDGELEVDGNIISLNYEDEVRQKGQKGGIFSKVFK